MLSEQYFKNTTWPSVENIESMLPNGEEALFVRYKKYPLKKKTKFSDKLLFLFFRVYEANFLDFIQRNVL